ncbi:MAG: cell envelope integrity protein TolA [bacterium]
MRERLRRLFYWIRAALFTVAIHGGIIFLLVYGLFSDPEKIIPAGKPIQAIAISQAELDRKKQEKVKNIEELERKKKEKEAEEKRKVEQEKKKKEEEEQKKKEQEQKKLEEEKKRKQEEKEVLQEKQRKQAIKDNCVELVQKEAESGEVNHELDELCEKQRDKLKQKRADEQKRKDEEKRKQEDLEKEKKAEEKRKKEEQEKKKQEQERKKKEEEKKKREAEERRKAEEKRKAEQALQAQLEAERKQKLAAQTESDAANALQAAAGRIKAAIENNWRRPGTSRVGLKAVIQLKVSRTGEVLQARVIKSSGDPFFDQSAELAVQKASPLPIPTDPKYYEYINEFNIEFNPDE